MNSKQESELWIQALYGTRWEDYEEPPSKEDALILLDKLKEILPKRKFRLVRRDIIESLII